MEAKDAIMRIKDFGLYHAIEDLPNSTLTVEAFNKAIKLLRLEESGKLKILPCKVGDTVYLTDHECTEGMKYNCEIDGIMEGYLCRTCGTYPCTLRPSVQEVVVDSITIVEDNEIIIEFKDLREAKIEDFGKTIFLAREEAEDKLKEDK